jgi:putrescine transport system substrate-binding protein
VPASLEFIDPEIKEDPQIYPSAETQEKLFSVGQVTPQYERARTRLWTRVKAGQ